MKNDLILAIGFMIMTTITFALISYIVVSHCDPSPEVIVYKYRYDEDDDWDDFQAITI